MANPVFAAVPQRQSDSTLTQVHSARLSEGEQEGDRSHTPGLESLRQNVHSNEARDTHGPAEHSRARHRRSLRTRPSHHRTSPRSEEHTSELQSRGHLVCRLLLEKKEYRN